MAEEAKCFSSIARSLQIVMNDEEGKQRGNLGRLVIAIHAAFLDSKFILADGSLFPEHSPAFDPSSLSLRYNILNLEGPAAVLKFSVTGNFLIVYGFLSGNHSNVYRVCFDRSKLAASLISSLHGAISDKEEKEIIKFWKIVRSKLSCPVRIAICYEKGICLPPCFM